MVDGARPATEADVDGPPGGGSHWHLARTSLNALLGLLALVEGLIGLVLAVWAIVEMAGARSDAVSLNQIEPRVLVQFDWARALEYLLPVVAASIVLLAGGLALLVATPVGRSARRIRRQLVTAAFLGQPVLLVSLVVWVRLAPGLRDFAQSLQPLRVLGVYQQSSMALFDVLFALLLVGSVIWLVEMAARRVPLSLAGVGAVLLVFAGLPWVAVNAVNSQTAAPSVRHPGTAAFWTSTLVLDGNFSTGDSVSCAPGGPCVATAAWALRAGLGDQPSYGWGSATLVGGRWVIGAVQFSTNLFGPETVACTPSRCLTAGPSEDARSFSAVWSTTDFGTHWSAVPSPGSSGVQTAVGSRLSCRFGRCLLVSRGDLLESDATGTSWHVALAIPATSPSSAPAMLLSAGCSSAVDCLAVGIADRVGVEYSSDDGGRSWVERSGLSKYIAGEELACSAASCHVVVGAGAGKTELVETHDNGATWAVDGSVPESGAIEGFACPGPQECLVLAQNGAARSPTVVVVTDDDGATWQVGAGLSGSTLHLDDLACASPTLCVATGADSGGAVLATTVDAGRRWSVQQFPHAPGF